MLISYHVFPVTLYVWLKKFDGSAEQAKDLVAIYESCQMGLGDIYSLFLPKMAIKWTQMSILPNK